MKKIRLLWPPRIYFKRKENITTSTDYKGRRYGDYTWLSIHFGHIGLNILPKHIRGIQKSCDWKEMSCSAKTRA